MGWRNTGCQCDVSQPLGTAPAPWVLIHITTCASPEAGYMLSLVLCSRTGIRNRLWKPVPHVLCFPSIWRTSCCRSRRPNHNRQFKAFTNTCTRLQHDLPFSLRCRYSKWHMWTCLSRLDVFWLPLHCSIYYGSALPCARRKLACQVCHIIMSMFVCIPCMFSYIDVLHHWLLMRLSYPVAMRPDLPRFCQRPA